MVARGEIALIIAAGEGSFGRWGTRGAVFSRDLGDICLGLWVVHWVLGCCCEIGKDIELETPC